MRAVQLTATGQPLENREIGLPEPGPGDIRVRIAAAGICHEVEGLSIGDRVCLHYFIACGACRHCRRGDEQFCTRAEMIGKDRDGGFAEQILVPARNTVRVPASVPLEQAALMMCSSATAWHALGKEAEIIGCSDHKHGELAILLGLAEHGLLDLAPAISHRIPLEAIAINRALDGLESGTEARRTVILP